MDISASDIFVVEISATGFYFVMYNSATQPYTVDSWAVEEFSDWCFSHRNNFFCDGSLFLFQISAYIKIVLFCLDFMIY